MNRSLTLGLLIAAGIALALRLPQLSSRPMHNDEAVNAIKFGQLWQKGSYQYDPREHHGPALSYTTSGLAWLTRAPAFENFTEARLRMVPVLFGVGLIVLLALVSDGLGVRGTIWAGLFTAVSPAFVFYSTDFIHEMLLVFFTFLAIGAGWRYLRTGKAVWACLTGIAIGLMDATKETFILAIAAAAVALSICKLWNRWIAASDSRSQTRRAQAGHIIAAVVLWVAVAITLFSSFFTNWQGPLDSLRTYQPWFARAGTQSVHAHPWSFYLHRLLWFHTAGGPRWTEALIAALACLGGLAGFSGKGLGAAHAGFVRFVALYTLLMLLIYSAIPYKTPWCLLGFWHGAILLAGIGAAGLISAAPRPWRRSAVTVILLAGTGHLAWQAWRARVPFAAEPSNPYVYAQTSPDVLNLVGKIDRLAKAAPEGQDMVVKVIAPDSDYWPLPWYLRRYHHVGWWDSLPADPFASVMIVSASLRTNLDTNKFHLMVQYFALRPQVLLELYVESGLWRSSLKPQPPAKAE